MQQQRVVAVGTRAEPCGFIGHGDAIGGHRRWTRSPKWRRRIERRRRLSRSGLTRSRTRVPRRACPQIRREIGSSAYESRITHAMQPDAPHRARRGECAPGPRWRWMLTIRPALSRRRAVPARAGLYARERDRAATGERRRTHRIAGLISARRAGAIEVSPVANVVGSRGRDDFGRNREAGHRMPPGSCRHGLRRRAPTTRMRSKSSRLV